MTVRSTELSGTWPFLSTKISQSATISQGSVATHLRGGEIFYYHFCYKFTATSVGERILKIDRHLAKLKAKI